MNQICFTKDFQYALNASMNPNFRVVLVTEHAPLPLQQNANIVRLPNLLPPYSVVSEYVDGGEDAFIERYTDYLYTFETIMNIYLLGSALLTKNIIIYTTDEEWGNGSIPFMDVLIRVMVDILKLDMNTVTNTEYGLFFNQTMYTIFNAANQLFMNGYINKSSFAKYLSVIPIPQGAMEYYLQNMMIDTSDVPPQLLNNLAQSVIKAQAVDQNLMPAMITNEEA